VRLAATHGLRKQKHRGSRPRAAQVSKRPIHQREHAVGEVVLLEELSAVDLPLEEGVEVEDSGAAVGGMDGRAGLAKGVDAHFGFSVSSVIEVCFNACMTLPTSSLVKLAYLEWAVKYGNRVLPNLNINQPTSVNSIDGCKERLKSSYGRCIK